MLISISRPWAGSECKHNSVTCPVLVYITDNEAGNQIVLLGEHRHVCEQLAQGHYLAVHRTGIKLWTSELTTKPQC